MPDWKYRTPFGIRFGIWLIIDCDKLVIIQKSIKTLELIVPRLRPHPKISWKRLKNRLNRSPDEESKVVWSSGCQGICPSGFLNRLNSVLRYLDRLSHTKLNFGVLDPYARCSSSPLPFSPSNLPSGALFHSFRLEKSDLRTKGIILTPKIAWVAEFWQRYRPPLFFAPSTFTYVVQVAALSTLVFLFCINY